ncbi:MAG TPA: chromate efflux transporter [Acidimicrobiales bacterium]|jgi:chromate transporter|nr:chromate efflux transporter [Acidimicrobiales bacterium]
MRDGPPGSATPAELVPLGTIAKEWTRLGCIGFGGPPTHVALLRRLCVEERAWLDPEVFEDGIAATNLLPGPASTQLAIFCAWKLRGGVGGLLGGLCFILPGLLLILGLAAVFLASRPPTWILGAAAGAGAAVPAIALNAARGLVPTSWRRAGDERAPRTRWLTYVGAGAVAAATIGQYLAAVLLVCGFLEIVAHRSNEVRPGSARVVLPAVVHVATAGGLGALAFVAVKVGALSYGGGFVIVPLMQHDAVSTYHWMSGAQFLNAVALGQVTPGPVVQTVAVVGYAAAGVGGGLLAAALAFAPSFAFVLVGGPRFDLIRRNTTVQSFFAGAGPAVIGAIAGSTVPLALELGHLWQLALLGGAAVWLFVLRRGVVSALLLMGLVGIVAAVAGAPIR